MRSHGAASHARAVQARGGVGEERIDDQRGLARAGDPGHAGEQTERDLRRHVAQVVAARADDRDLPLRIRAHAQARHGDAPLAGQVLAGDRGGAGLDVRRRALRDQVSAVHAGAGTQVDDVIGRFDRLLVVLDHDDGVAEVAQLLQGREQAAVVALVQADRGLIEDVHDAGEPGAHLAGEPDALRFPARERLGGAIERQVVQAHVAEEAQPLDDALHDLAGDLAAPARQLERAEQLQRAPDGQVRDLRQALVGDEHEARRAVEARAVALRARPHAQVAAEFLAHHRRLGLAVAARQVRQDALEGMTLARLAARLVAVAELDLLAAAAVQQHLLHLRRAARSRASRCRSGSAGRVTG